jgi:ubiquinone/menaquinone biosynthesis C-methylase UbiE
MSSENAEQIAEWNGELGQRWAESQRQIDGLVAAFGQAALKRAAAQAGERVIDVGCGCGDTTLELARSVGQSGRVLGIDVSQQMLAVARVRTDLAAWPHLGFRGADASDCELPADTDLVFSRFGVMFFAEPVSAFRHLRRSLRSRGRCVFVCWRAPRDNSWAMTPLVAARKAMGITPAPADPYAPGPFAFADDGRVRAILSDAGFEKIDVQRFDTPVLLGTTPRLAAESAVRVGPTSRLVRDVGSENLPAILDAVKTALGAFASHDGQVRLTGSTWIVAASNP